jgi:hypothetical protein
VSLREERIAANEGLFREVNERIVELTEGWGAATLDLMCECGEKECMKRVEVTLGEYERIRQDPHRFIVLPGHELPDVEDVVERSDGHFVVEKHVATHDPGEESDRRTDGT